MSEELDGDLKWLVQSLFDKLLEEDRKGIVALWNGEHSQCLASVCGHQVYDVMLDVGKRLSMMPPAMPELVEGHILVRSASETTNDLTLKVALEIPPEFQSIVVVFDNERGDAVFCIGSPLNLAFLSLRSCASVEEVNGGPFKNLAPPPTGQN